MANAEKRLAEAGIELAVRTPSNIVERLLGMMESTEPSRLSGFSRATAISTGAGGRATLPVTTAPLQRPARGSEG